MARARRRFPSRSVESQKVGACDFADFTRSERGIEDADSEVVLVVGDL